MDGKHLGDCARIMAHPQNANEWLENAKAVAELVRQGRSQLSIANAIGVSDSVVSIWKKAGSRWPQAVKSKILQEPDLFPAPLLNALGKKLWTDVDASKKSNKSDGRRSSRPKLSLEAAVDLILSGKKPRNDRRALTDINRGLESLVNIERARNQSLRREIQKIKEEKDALLKQLSLHRIDDLIRKNNDLRKQIAKISSGNKSKREKSANEIYMENNLISALRMRVDLDYLQKTLLIIAPNQDILDDLCEKILRMK